MTKQAILNKVLKLVHLNGGRMAKDPKEVSWDELGVPDGMVREHEEAAAQGLVIKDPPRSLTERTIKSIMNLFRWRGRP